MSFADDCSSLVFLNFLDATLRGDCRNGALDGIKRCVNNAAGVSAWVP